ncbi:hypothetical protein ACWGRK_00110 [Saccharomonospora azurea]
MTSPQPPLPTGQYEPPRQRSTIAMTAFGLVVGLLVGGGGVGLAWTLMSPGSADAGAEADAHAACEIVERTPRIVATKESNADLLRWSGAVSLAWAASDQDETYTGLYKAVLKPYHLFQTTYTTEGPEFDQAMQAARDACAEL